MKFLCKKNGGCDFLFVLHEKEALRKIANINFIFVLWYTEHTQRWKGDVVYILNTNQVTKNGGDLEVYIWLASTNRIY